MNCLKLVNPLEGFHRWGAISLLQLFLVASFSCSDSSTSPGDTTSPRKGDMSMKGGSPTVRRAYEVEEDDPETTNDEANDQPVSFFGTVTLSVYNHDSGNDYTLDGDIEDGTLERLYFPKGGWVDFWDCELDDDLTGTCYDEEGRGWDIQGESSFGSTSWIGTEELDEDEDETEDEYRRDEYVEDALDDSYSEDYAEDGRLQDPP